MSQCKKDIPPLLTHWSYVFLALTHRNVGHYTEIPSYPFSILVTMVQLSRAISTARDDLLPAMLDTGEQVLDEDDVLLLAEVLQMSSRLIQLHHSAAITGDLLLKTLVERRRNKGQMKYTQNLIQVRLSC